MDIETLRRLLAGGEDAVKRVADWLDGLSEEDKARLAEIGTEEVGSGEGGADAAKPAAEATARFWADLTTLKTAVNSTPGETEAELAAMESRARRLGTCETVQVLGLRSYQRRLLGDLDHAERLLNDALALAPACSLIAPGHAELSACLLDLQRRLAILEAALGRPLNGLRLAQSALDGYEVLGHPGHDIDRDGIASCHYARGEIRFELRDLAGSAADFSVCLDRFPAASPVWERVQQDFTTVLARTDRAGREMAFELQERRRLRMSHRAGTTEFAFFFWTDGQLAVALGRQRGIKKMRLALNEFAAQGMPDQVVGVGHDMALAMWPNRARIKKFFRKELHPLVDGLVRDRRQLEALNELVSLLRGSPCPDSPSLLAWALRRLREAAGAHLPPCLIDLPPGLLG